MQKLTRKYLFRTLNKIKNVLCSPIWGDIKNKNLPNSSTKRANSGRLFEPILLIKVIQFAYTCINNINSRKFSKHSEQHQFTSLKADINAAHFHSSLSALQAFQEATFQAASFFCCYQGIFQRSRLVTAYIVLLYVSEFNKNAWKKLFALCILQFVYILY